LFKRLSEVLFGAPSEIFETAFVVELVVGDDEFAEIPNRKSFGG